MLVTPIRCCVCIIFIRCYEMLCSIHFSFPSTAKHPFSLHHVFVFNLLPRMYIGVSSLPCLTPSFIHSSIHPSFSSFIHLSIQSSIIQFIHLFNHPSILPFFHSSIYSLIHPYILSLSISFSFY